ncbi:transcriptional regulator [Thalassobacillus devorans]|uniref:Transcriptional regulator n=1 Tax=Thalassobacillus devorans TaxID=279813 RepID=A0ABQ1PNF6_9BACI|nr:tetratricopeptide repeat protein [Thalassobacillus devorans]NIK30463.1 tetratricopeptide (TPR) repeat protein [Thalassobacillus devorans]GGD00089.1 transcriptional regulator [Thalassobacillus devorans]
MELTDKYQKVDYGKLIYLERVKQRLTQNELSHGICSVPYLSKLENQRISDPNPETVSLLLEKLTVDYRSQVSRVQEVLEDMEHWYSCITSKNDSQMESYYQKLKSLPLHYYPDLTIWFQLIAIRYFIRKHDTLQAEMSLQKLSAKENKLDRYQTFYYLYFSGLIDCLKQHYKDGLLNLHEAEEFAKEQGIHDSELLYHLALTYSHISHSSLAIYYSQIAKRYFDQTMNIHRGVDCQVILGINFLRINRYDSAEKVFKDILRISQSINDTQLVGKTYHNLGFLYAEKGELEAALRYYYKALEIKKEYSKGYYSTVLRVIHAHQQRGETGQAMAWVDEVLENDDHEPDTTIQFKLKKLELAGEGDDYYQYINDIALPYFLKVNDKKSINRYCQKAALYYEENFHYKKANGFYKLILNQGGEIS